MADTDALIVSIGQDCGPVATRQTSSGRAFRIDDGVDMHALTDDEYTAWRAALGPPASAGQPWSRKSAIGLARRVGVRRARRIVDALIRDKLVWEVDVLSNDLVLFAGLHRVRTHMSVLGPAADDSEAFDIGIAGQVRLPVSADTANMYLHASSFDDLWSVCQAVADVSPTPAHPGWPKEHMLATAFLAEARPLIAAGAMSVQRAHPEWGTYT